MRNRTTGNSDFLNVFVGEHEDACNFMEDWNRKNIEGYDKNVLSESYIDGTDGLVAEVYFNDIENREITVSDAIDFLEFKLNSVSDVEKSMYEFILKTVTKRKELEQWLNNQGN